MADDRHPVRLSVTQVEFMQHLINEKGLDFFEEECRDLLATIDTTNEATALELKKLYKGKIKDYSKQCNEHVDKYGPTPCDYLIHRREMLCYYKGAYNTLIELGI